MSTQFSRHLGTSKYKPTILVFVGLCQSGISGDSDIYWILKTEDESERKSEGVDKKDLPSWRDIVTKEKSREKK